MSRIFRVSTIGAVAVATIAILAAVRGNYEMAGEFLGAGALAYIFLFRDDE